MAFEGWVVLDGAKVLHRLLALCKFRWLGRHKQELKKTLKTDLVDSGKSLNATIRETFKLGTSAKNETLSTTEAKRRCESKTQHQSPHTTFRVLDSGALNSLISSLDYEKLRSRYDTLSKLSQEALKLLTLIAQL